MCKGIVALAFAWSWIAVAYTHPLRTLRSRTSLSVGTNTHTHSVPFMQVFPRGGGAESASQRPKPNYSTLFVLGGPGAGKGTQSSLLKSHYKMVHLSVGDLLRKCVNQGGGEGGGEVKKIVHECIKNGAIVPVEISLGLVKAEMESFPTGTTFLIDGFPRNFDNLKGWGSVMGTVSDVVGVIFYDVSLALLESRILLRGESSGRVDDNVEALRKRFGTFESETMAVLKRIEEGGEWKVGKINGEGSVDEVWKRSKELVDEFLRPTIVDRLTALEIIYEKSLPLASYIATEIEADFVKHRRAIDEKFGASIIDQESVNIQFQSGTTVMVKRSRIDLTSGEVLWRESIVMERGEEGEDIGGEWRVVWFDFNCNLK